MAHSIGSTENMTEQTITLTEWVSGKKFEIPKASLKGVKSKTIIEKANELGATSWIQTSETPEQIAEMLKA
jgi:hypothetical protein